MTEYEIMVIVISCVALVVSIPTGIWATINILNCIFRFKIEIKSANLGLKPNSHHVFNVSISVGNRTNKEITITKIDLKHDRKLTEFYIDRVDDFPTDCNMTIKPQHNTSQWIECDLRNTDFHSIKKAKLVFYTLRGKTIKKLKPKQYKELTERKLNR